jgi:DNA polymerase III subunit gamma/tau
MSHPMYQVIARKYRPQTFSDVVNQEHVKTTLENALAGNRIAHGYIFSGPRGTGKTTIARILARCLNCVKGPTSQPDGTCSSCLEIAAGNGVDVIEIDAASNRGINEMRELRENVRYRPARDRYKVFIIDEAHQITSEAFNALLKTIEEPPEWVVFVLCTTEPHKIPATIASRCQHFTFRSVEFDELIKRIDWICKQEGIEADAEALAVLAQAGEGSVRDSLSALDQAIACCGTKLDAAEIRALLGAFSLDSLTRVTDALFAGENSRMLEIVEELERNGHNLQHFSRELSRYFRNLLVARIAGSDTRLIAASPAERERLAKIGKSFSEEDLTRYLQLSLILFTDLQASLQPRFHLELGLLKMVQAGKLTSIEEALGSLAGKPVETATPPAAAASRTPSPQAPPPRTGPSPFEMDRAKKAGRPEPQSIGATALAPEPAPVPEGTIDWREKLHAVLMELRMQFTADAVQHATVTESGSELHFVTSKEFAMAMKESDLALAVKRVSPRLFKIRISIGEAAEAAEMKPKTDEPTERAMTNPEVRRFREVLGGEVRTVRNLKE